MDVEVAGEGIREEALDQRARSYTPRLNPRRRWSTENPSKPPGKSMDSSQGAGNAISAGSCTRYDRGRTGGVKG